MTCVCICQILSTHQKCHKEIASSTKLTDEIYLKTWWIMCAKATKDLMACCWHKVNTNDTWWRQQLICNKSHIQWRWQAKLHLHSNMRITTVSESNWSTCALKRKWLYRSAACALRKLLYGRAAGSLLHCKENDSMGEPRVHLCTGKNN